MKGYLRIERNPETERYEAYWYYDDEDPDETLHRTDIQKRLPDRGPATAR